MNQVKLYPNRPPPVLLNSTIDLLDSRTDEDALKLLRNAAQSVTGAERSPSTSRKISQFDRGSMLRSAMSCIAGATS
jgi:hypothetical protein